MMPWLERWLAAHGDELVAVRRHLHRHPELGYQEFDTTEYLRSRLAAAGLDPRVLPGGTGLICDISPTGAGDAGPVTVPVRTVALRADIDALPLQDAKDVPYRSVVPGVCHACGHDAHTAMVLGAGLALAAAAPALPGRVRLLFQQAEETLPGGSLDAIEAGVLDGVDVIYALHCDPRLEVGKLGVRAGSITSASDRVEVRLQGPGGHTSRPHLTVDVVYALGRIITDLPGLLSRTVDPRIGLSLVWGAVHAGSTPNAIPRTGSVTGTVRVLDRQGWQMAPGIVRRTIEQVTEPTGATVEIEYVSGVPPVVNDRAATEVMRAAVAAELGEDAVVETVQSLGGEDFGWYLDHIPGALARLGVQRPGRPPLDLHQPTFDIDEHALPAGVRALVATALAALDA